MTTNRLLVKQEVATYASMLLDSAFEQGGQDRVLEVRDQLDFAVAAYRGNTELRDALTSSGLTSDQCYNLVKGVFEGLDPLVVSVIAVMAERENLGELNQVVSTFKDAAEEKLGVCVVDVTTVVELDDELRKIICDKLSKDLGMGVVLNEHIDTSILGGIIMTTHGKRIDASVLSKLESTRNMLTESNDGGEC